MYSGAHLVTDARPHDVANVVADTRPDAVTDDGSHLQSHTQPDGISIQEPVGLTDHGTNTCTDIVTVKVHLRRALRR